MSRRASLPGAEELFRSTVPAPVIPPAAPREPDLPGAAPRESRIGPTLPKHEQKVTFYCTGEDLTELERVRLALRSEHRLPVDRSRIVRAALAVVLEEFGAEGSGSRLVGRLRQWDGTHVDKSPIASRLS